MAKPVAAQVFTAIPARHDHDVPTQPLAFQYAQDHQSGAAFTVIVLDRPVIGYQTPAIMRGLGEFLVSLQIFDEFCRGGFVGSGAA